MGVPSKPLPTLGGDTQTEDPKTREVLQELQGILSAGVDDSNIVSAGLSESSLTTALLQLLGISEGGTTRRGKSIIATEQSRSNAAYGTLAMPDQVAGIVVPTDGLLFIQFSALVKESVFGQATAALFVGSDQLRSPDDNATPLAQYSTIGATVGGTPTANLYRRIITSGVGIDSASAFGLGIADVDYGGDGLLTKPLAARPIAVEVAAGTYTISVQYNAISGSVTAKERSLRVWTKGF